MAGHYPGILMTGHIGTNTPKFVPPRWGRPRFDPTQTGLCKFGWVWSSLKSCLISIFAPMLLWDGRCLELSIGSEETWLESVWRDLTLVKNYRDYPFQNYLVVPWVTKNRYSLQVALWQWFQRKTKWQRLKGKIVSALFSTFFPHFFPKNFLEMKGFFLRE